MAIKSFRTVGFSLLMVFMLAVAACGGDDDGNGNGNGDGNGGSITIETPGMSYDPDEVTINAGEDYEFTIDNTDGQIHTFTIDELDVNIEVAAGESDSATLNVPDAGEYTFYCTVPGHRESGQEGALIVE